MSENYESSSSEVSESSADNSSYEVETDLECSESFEDCSVDESADFSESCDYDEASSEYFEDCNLEENPELKECNDDEIIEADDISEAYFDDCCAENPSYVAEETADAVSESVEASVEVNSEDVAEGTDAVFESVEASVEVNSEGVAEETADAVSESVEASDEVNSEGTAEETADTVSESVEASDEVNAEGVAEENANAVSDSNEASDEVNAEGVAEENADAVSDSNEASDEVNAEGVAEETDAVSESVEASDAAETNRKESEINESYIDNNEGIQDIQPKKYDDFRKEKIKVDAEHNNKVAELNAAKEETALKFSEISGKTGGTVEYKKALAEYNDAMDRQNRLNDELVSLTKKKESLETENIEARNIALAAGNEASAQLQYTAEKAGELNKAYEDRLYSRKPNKNELRSIMEENRQTIKELQGERDNIKQAMSAKMDELSEYVQSKGFRTPYESRQDEVYCRLSDEYNALKNQYSKAEYNIVKLDENNIQIGEITDEKYEPVWRTDLKNEREPTPEVNEVQLKETPRSCEMLTEQIHYTDKMKHDAQSALEANPERKEDWAVVRGRLSQEYESLSKQLSAATAEKEQQFTELKSQYIALNEEADSPAKEYQMQQLREKGEKLQKEIAESRSVQHYAKANAEELGKGLEKKSSYIGVAHHEFTEAHSSLIQKQGEAVENFKGTCGDCSCANSMTLLGDKHSEAEVVGKAKEIGACTNIPIAEDMPEELKEEIRGNNGGTSVAERETILNAFGYECKSEKMQSLDEICNHIQNGEAAIINVDHRVLNKDTSAMSLHPCGTDHALTITGIEVDAAGKPIGLWIHDTGVCSNMGNAFFCSAKDYETWKSTPNCHVQYVSKKKE